jgi:hypothetical protein
VTAVTTVVLPMPPGATRVTNCRCCRSALIMTIILMRPMMRAYGSGRVASRTREVAIGNNGAGSLASGPTNR